jgi:hypothetical protein
MSRSLLFAQPLRFRPSTTRLVLGKRSPGQNTPPTKLPSRPSESSFTHRVKKTVIRPVRSTSEGSPKASTTAG